ncbi:MAG: tetratricopeptide repeat protein [Prevotella sp.]|nr:tetratricopeptide repeat protein [Prevotella sp.]
MRKTVLTIFVLLLTLTVAGETTNPESERRYEHLTYLYNNDLNDSLIIQAPVDMTFYKKTGDWENYYRTWTHLVNTYTFSGKVNTALKEVKLMHSDATERHDKFGLALADYAMGNAYNNMGYLDEAIDCYDQSLKLIDDVDINSSTVNDIFSYYCDALNEKGAYEVMTSITTRWRAYLDKMKQAGKMNKEMRRVWYAYYYLACAQQNLGLNRLNEAEADIDAADENKVGGQVFIGMSVLYYRAQLMLQRGDYRKALEYNTLRMNQSRDYDDKSSMVLIYQQRAQILMNIGQYEEAAVMYRNISELTDSVYKRDARTQITELNTLFRVSELDMEKQLERNRYLMLTAIIVCVALALLVGYWYWMNRRLRKKNEELAVARDKAQESSRMKSAFIKNISHEIRTPLNILSGFTQIISQTDVEQPLEIRVEASRNIQENTNRITSLVNRLLDLSELSSRNSIDRSDSISANRLCQEAIQNSGIAEKPDHAFSFVSTVDDGVMLQTSVHYATLAIVHLIDNAEKFTPEGGRITMKCDVKEQMLCVTVEDTGCGIPEGKAETIFDEFVQLDEYKDGVGIGLTLSRNTVRYLGGDIVLDATYDKGARFFVLLPL